MFGTSILTEDIIRTCKQSIDVLSLGGRPTDEVVDDNIENLGDDKYFKDLQEKAADI